MSEMPFLVNVEAPQPPTRQLTIPMRRVSEEVQSERLGSTPHADREIELELLDDETLEKEIAELTEKLHKLQKGVKGDKKSRIDHHTQDMEQLLAHEEGPDSQICPLPTPSATNGCKKGDSGLSRGGEGFATGSMTEGNSEYEGDHPNQLSHHGKSIKQDSQKFNERDTQNNAVKDNEKVEEGVVHSSNVAEGVHVEGHRDTPPALGPSQLNRGTHYRGRAGWAPRAARRTGAIHPTTAVAPGQRRGRGYRRVSRGRNGRSQPPRRDENNRRDFGSPEPNQTRRNLWGMEIDANDSDGSQNTTASEKVIKARALRAAQSREQQEDSWDTETVADFDTFNDGGGLPNYWEDPLLFGVRESDRQERNAFLESRNLPPQEENPLLDYDVPYGVDAINLLLGRR